jgi:predicted metalloenzyme YecM
MYYDKVTFPIYLFKLSFEDSTIEDVFSNVFYSVSQPSFEKDFAKILKMKSNQDLFAYLVTVLPPIMLSAKEEINISNIRPDLSVFKDAKTFLDLLKIRIDIKAIRIKLSEMKDDPICLKIDSDELIKDLIVFVYQYVFVELSKIIIATKDGHKLYYFDFVKHYSRVMKYEESSPNRDDLNSSQNVFIKNFYQSFQTNDKNLINQYVSQISLMTNNKQLKKRVFFIFEEYISLHEKIKIRDRYIFYKYIFIYFIAKFFFKHLSKEDIDEDRDDVIEGYYRNFLRSVSS